MDQIIIKCQQWIAPFLPNLRDWVSLRQVSQALRHFGEHEGCKGILILTYREAKQLKAQSGRNPAAKWFLDHPKEVLKYRYSDMYLQIAPYSQYIDNHIEYINTSFNYIDTRIAPYDIDTRTIKK